MDCVLVGPFVQTAALAVSAVVVVVEKTKIQTGSFLDRGTFFGL